MVRDPGAGPVKAGSAWKDELGKYVARLKAEEP